MRALPILVDGMRPDAFTVWIHQGTARQQIHIKDIAPTVAKLLDVEHDDKWEGVSLL